MLNLAAVLIYLASAVACGAALRTAAVRAPADRFVWVAVGALFALLAVSRAFGLEEQLRDSLRALLSSGLYQERRQFQAPVAAAVIAGLAVAGWASFTRLSRVRHSAAGRALVWAQAAALGLAGLVLVRIVSLHFVDKLLFSGPLHLNWLLDIGATLVVAFCALTYARVAGRGRAARGTRDR